jgi:hypothetical protein
MPQQGCDGIEAFALGNLLQGAHFRREPSGFGLQPGPLLLIEVTFATP